MDDRLTNLEIRYTHQEDMVEELSLQVHELQKQVTLLTEQLRLQKEWMQSMSSQPIAHPSEETPPPHY